MTIEEFADLPELLQANYLQEEGVYIGKTKTRSVVKVLYQVETFYAVITYSAYRKVIADITFFHEPDSVIEFIDQVVILDMVGTMN